MKTTGVVQKRTRLQQSLILVIMILVATMMLMSHGELGGYWINVLAVVCLLACVYVLVKERELNNREAMLLDKLVRKDRAFEHLGQELLHGQFELEENREKAEEMEARLKEIAKIYRAINRVNGAARTDGVPRTVLSAALELVGGDWGSIMLLENDKQHLRIETSIGIGKRAHQDRQKVGEGVAGSVAEFGVPARISGESQYDEFFHNISEQIGRIKSALSVPIKLRSQTIGVMILGLAASAKDEFDDYQMSLATIFGEHASVPIMYSCLRRSLKNEDGPRA